MSNPNKDLQKYVLQIQRAIESLTTREHLEEVGNKVANDIRIRTRLGNSVNQHGGEKSRLKKLSPKYVESRARFRNLSELTTPKKSNLTRTGHMLSSLGVVKIDTATNSIVIEPQGTDMDGISNMDKAVWNEEKGRPFLYMSELEIQKTRIFWLRKFSSLLKKINLR